MSDLIYRRERNFGIVLVPIGVLGLTGAFAYLFSLATTKHGLTSNQTLTISVLFVVSLLLTALGGHVKVVTSLTTCQGDEDEN